MILLKKFIVLKLTFIYTMLPVKRFHRPSFPRNVQTTKGRPLRIALLSWIASIAVLVDHDAK